MFRDKDDPSMETWHATLALAAEKGHTVLVPGRGAFIVIDGLAVEQDPKHESIVRPNLKVITGGKAAA